MATGTGKYNKSATARFQTFSIRCFVVAFKLLKQHPKTATGLYVILTKEMLKGSLISKGILKLDLSSKNKTNQYHYLSSAFSLWAEKLRKYSDFFKKY